MNGWAESPMLMSPPLMRHSMADVLKKARMEMNLSQLELGRLCGWPRTRVSMLEAGRIRERDGDRETLRECLGIRLPPPPLDHSKTIQTFRLQRECDLSCAAELSASLSLISLARGRQR